MCLREGGGNLPRESAASESGREKNLEASSYEGDLESETELGFEFGCEFVIGLRLVYKAGFGVCIVPISGGYGLRSVVV